MSDVMFYGVLRMPFEMAMGDYMSQWQFYQRVQELATRLETAESQTDELMTIFNSLDDYGKKTLLRMAHAMPKKEAA